MPLEKSTREIKKMNYSGLTPTFEELPTLASPFYVKNVTPTETLAFGGF